MKRLLYILLLSLPIAGSAQKLEGFWGLNMYMSSETVKDIIFTRTGKMPDEGSGHTVIGYRNIDFGGQKAYFVQLMFHNNKLYGGDIILSPERSELLSVYHQVVAGLTAKYKAPQEENCLYSYAGAGYDKVPANAIRAVWNFPPGKSVNPDARIIASIENNSIKISYRDGLIYSQLITLQERHKLQDY